MTPQRLQRSGAAQSAGLRPHRGRAVVLAVLLAGLLPLSACSGTKGGVVYFTNFTAGYVPSSLAAAMPLLVETYGSPTAGLSAAEVTQASVEALRERGPAWLPRNYTGNPEDVPRPAYLLRIFYSVPKTFSRQDLCSPEMSLEVMEAARTSTDADSTRVVAGLCRGKSAIAEAEGSPGPEPDVKGENFAAFIGLLGRQLLPRRNPITMDDCLFQRCD